MSFGKNLQKLRKKSNLSQEQLSVELGVTRQSVSKWESDHSVPDMEKLAIICELFNVSLDVLVNGNVDELNIDENGTNFSKLIKGVDHYIKKTLRLFEVTSFKGIVTIVIQMIIIGLILLVLSIPFHMIDRVVSNMFMLRQTQLGDAISILWSFIVNFIYIVASIVVFFYIFKIKFLDTLEVGKPDGKFTDSSEIKPESVTKKKDVSFVSKRGRSIEFDNIKNLFLFCFKFFIIIILFPIITSFIVSVIIATILILLIFNGLVLIGPIVAVLALSLFIYAIIELFIKFIMNAVINKRRIITSIISSFIIGGVGIALSLWYMSGLTFVNVGVSEEVIIVYETIYMNDDLNIGTIRNFTLITDNSIGNDVIEFRIEHYMNDVELSLIQGYSNIWIGFARNFGDLDSINFRQFRDEFIYNLNNNEVHINTINFNYKVFITGNEHNINILLDNLNSNFEWYIENNITNDRYINLFEY